MSNAWEVTPEDVANVLRVRGITKNEKELSEIHGQLDMDAIEQAALADDDIDEQTACANNEIEDQMIRLGIIPEERSRT